MASKTIINQNFDGEFSLIIKHKLKDGYEIIEPVVEDGVKWETEKQGSPGKLTFKVYKSKNDNLNFQEGDGVALRYRDNSNEEWIPIFEGWVFTKKTDKSGWINVTAYDQLRYLKNKMTKVYKELKASDVVTEVAKECALTLGTIDTTNYVISERLEDDQTLFDIIQNALDLTFVSTTTLYVLYDDCGKLCLRDANNMKLDYVLNAEVAEDFEYTSSIDEETYNEIELYYDNDKTNKREYYNAIDPTNVGNWGRLRLTKNIHEKSNLKDKVQQLLEAYNRKTRKLTVKNAFGDYRCRAGASVICQLEVGDIVINNYMLISKATHTFSKNEYRMDLTLEGFKNEPKSSTDSSIVYTEENVVDVSTDTPIEDTPKTYTVTMSCSRASAKDSRYASLSYRDKPDQICKSVKIKTGDVQSVTVNVAAGTDVDFTFWFDLGDTLFGPIAKFTNKTSNWELEGAGGVYEGWTIKNISEDSIISYEWLR